MKLYFSPGACSLSPRIVLMEAGLPFTAVKTDLKSKKTASGADYLAVNSKGAVPALELDDGQVLTEGPAIVQYLADLRPESGLAPRAGSFERYRLMEILNYITSEVHKSFSPLFSPDTPADSRKIAVDNLAKKFDWLSKHIAGKKFLMGDTFTVADAYLFTVLRWSGLVRVDLGQWPALAEYVARVAERPKVKEALQAEGLK
ncbi:MAG TPA: glutathione transferase GstA [Steroidobacteraceae bacterium]|jgi:glutathione S-transferase|nr:glutathione transferase GstA [Steroidobacteraceae bacterium]